MVSRVLNTLVRFSSECPIVENLSRKCLASVDADTLLHAEILDINLTLEELIESFFVRAHVRVILT